MSAQLLVSVWVLSRVQVRVWVLSLLETHAPQACSSAAIVPPQTVQVAGVVQVGLFSLFAWSQAAQWAVRVISSVTVSVV